MTWGAILLGMFLIVGLRTRRSSGSAALFPVLVGTAAVLAVVYFNLGRV